MFKQIALSLLVASIATPVLAGGEVNVYSARKEQLIKPLFDKFTEQTGINVNLVTGKDDALLERLKLEGENTPADLLMTADAGRLHRAVAMQLTQPVESAILQQDIPAALRDPDNQWFGLTSRARPIFYAKDNIKPEELSTYEDLADPKWKGRICVRSSDNIYNQSMIGSMITTVGTEKAQAWADGIVKNFARPPEGGDRDQIKAAASGQCDIALANTYYYGQMLVSDEAEEKAAAEKVAIFWPNQAEGDRGVHINISGAAVTKTAKNKDNAIKLMEFLVNDESQKWYAEANQEYPVKANIAPSEMLKGWGEFKADSVNLSELGKNNAEAVKILDKAGWK
ncbi:Fe(3+) ABC transporter substrate-binding protein [Thiothrix winogradskyi]|uniref:Fe(3+) ABC transporter substrate-binding protein n=1 Tax=Thiothrix winogradskyi TaxID=96472 RepID=A0ABY3SUX5_9GAMM|nr:Fe(3+) ABC transporter substrate-binding protein [Thiothrix winogradskyi]UJS22613.1 Fe(3+) ABC transporter substrate-binding protein [Thiothrix winogradskyi]